MKPHDIWTVNYAWRILFITPWDMQFAEFLHHCV